MNKKSIELLRLIETNVKTAAKFGFKDGMDKHTFISCLYDDPDLVNLIIELEDTAQCEVSIHFDSKNQIQVSALEIGKNKYKLELRSNGSTKALNCLIDDITILVVAHKDGKHSASNSRVIKAIENLLENLKDNNIPEINEIQENQSFTGIDLLKLKESKNTIAINDSEDSTNNHEIMTLEEKLKSDYSEIDDNNFDFSNIEST